MNKEAIRIILNECECVNRECGIEKSCSKCDLVMPSKEPILQAYEMAIQALSQEPCEDAEQIDYHDDFETALKKINDYERTRDERVAISILNAYKEGYKSAIEDYKQEPCDDAISREAVLNAIEHEDKWLLDAKGHNGLTEIAFSGLKARVDALPSVTQKSGKWIAHSDGIWIEYYECSECGRAHTIHSDYCPNCGADMRDKAVEE